MLISSKYDHDLSQFASLLDISITNIYIYIYGSKSLTKWVGGSVLTNSMVLAFYGRCHIGHVTFIICGCPLPKPTLQKLGMKKIKQTTHIPKLLPSHLRDD